MSTATTVDAQATPEVLKKPTPKQDRFCREYLIDLNGTQAAIRASYSSKTAAEQAYDLLRRPHIAARIAELALKREKRANKSADDVIKELECVGFARLNKVISFNESGLSFVKNSDEIDDDTMAALESVEVTEIVGKNEDSNDMLKTKVRLHPKMPALNLLAKHHGLVNDNPDLNVIVPIQVNVIDYSKVELEDGK